VNVAKWLTKLIEKCTSCRVIDKPFVKYEVYYRWLPHKVHTLVIVESPPPGYKDDFLYNLDRKDRLRRNLKRILGLNFESDDELLRWLKARGIFITDTVKCRPFNKREIKSMMLECYPILREEISILGSKRVIVLGRVAEEAIERIKLGKDIEVEMLPHPNYIMRFRRNLIKKLREVLLC